MANTPNNPCPWCHVLWMTGIKPEPSPKRDEHTRACNFVKICLAVARAAGEAAFDTRCGGWTLKDLERISSPDNALVETLKRVITAAHEERFLTRQKMDGDGDQGGYLTMDYKAMNELIKRNVSGISSAIERQLKEFRSGMEDEMADTINSSLDKILFKNMETFGSAMNPSDPTLTKITPIRDGGTIWNILNQHRPICYTDKATDTATDTVTEMDTDIPATSTAAVTASETPTSIGTELVTTSATGSDSLATATVTASETSTIAATELPTNVDTENASDTATRDFHTLFSSLD